MISGFKNVHVGRRPRRDRVRELVGGHELVVAAHKEVHGTEVGRRGHRINIDDGQRGGHNDPTNECGVIDAQSDVGSEAVARDNKRAVARLDRFNRGAEVVSFGAAARVFASRPAGAAKVEPKHPMTGLHESATEGGNHGVVAGPAIERVGVADHASSRRVLGREKVALEMRAVGALEVQNLDINRFDVVTLPVT